MGSLSTDALSEELARTLRVAHVLRLVDLFGHASVRTGDSAKILVSPGRAPGSLPPNRLSASDVLTVNLEGNLLVGKSPAPRDLAMHLAIYRNRPDAKAVIHTHQPEMLLFGLVRRELLPLMHQSADKVQDPLPRFGHGELVASFAQGEALSQTMGDSVACHLPGHGFLVVGPGLVEALTWAHQLEELARMNRLAASMGAIKTVSAEQGTRIASQRAGMEDFRAYYASLDPGPKPPPPPMPAASSIDGVRQRVISACRVLQRFGLARHLEHVSHRLPDKTRFVINPRGNMAHLLPEELATVDMEGRWVEGPSPPPPFCLLHRDIFAARPDVQAIVHTHEIYGRLYPAAGLAIPPLHRLGANIAHQPLPVYDVPDLIFDEEPRRAVVALLSQGSMVHERAHGTDYVAENIEEAVATAVHREWLARLHHRASQLGTPQSLPGPVVASLKDELPSASEWWDYWRAL